MDSLYILIPIALVFCAVAVKLLLWAINNGQYDDLDKEAHRILMEDAEVTAAAARGADAQGAISPATQAPATRAPGARTPHA